MSDRFAPEDARFQRLGRAPVTLATVTKVSRDWGGVYPHPLVADLDFWCTVPDPRLLVTLTVSVEAKGLQPVDVASYLYDAQIFRGGAGSSLHVMECMRLAPVSPATPPVADVVGTAAAPEVWPPRGLCGRLVEVQSGADEIVGRLHLDLTGVAAADWAAYAARPDFRVLLTASCAPRNCRLSPEEWKWVCERFSAGGRAVTLSLGGAVVPVSRVTVARAGLGGGLNELYVYLGGDVLPYTDVTLTAPQFWSISQDGEGGWSGNPTSITRYDDQWLVVGLPQDLGVGMNCTVSAAPASSGGITWMADPPDNAATFAIPLGQIRVDSATPDNTGMTIDVAISGPSPDQTSLGDPANWACSYDDGEGGQTILRIQTLGVMSEGAIVRIGFGSSPPPWNRLVTVVAKPASAGGIVRMANAPDNRATCRFSIAEITVVAARLNPDGTVYVTLGGGVPSDPTSLLLVANWDYAYTVEGTTHVTPTSVARISDYQVRLAFAAGQGPGAGGDPEISAKPGSAGGIVGMSATQNYCALQMPVYSIARNKNPAGTISPWGIVEITKANADYETARNTTASVTAMGDQADSHIGVVSQSYASTKYWFYRYGTIVNVGENGESIPAGAQIIAVRLWLRLLNCPGAAGFVIRRWDTGLAQPQVAGLNGSAAPGTLMVTPYFDGELPASDVSASGEIRGYLLNAQAVADLQASFDAGVPHLQIALRAVADANGVHPTGADEWGAHVDGTYAPQLQIYYLLS